MNETAMKVARFNWDEADHPELVSLKDTMQYRLDLVDDRLDHRIKGLNLRFVVSNILFSIAIFLLIVFN